VTFHNADQRASPFLGKVITNRWYDVHTKFRENTSNSCKFIRSDRHEDTCLHTYL